MSTKQLYDPNQIRTANMLPLRETDLHFGDEISLTKQSEAAACDINNIMAPYARMDMKELLAADPGQYLDLADGNTFHEAMNIICDATEKFDALPANIRSAFNNDPEAFLTYAADPKNLEGMVEMGLAEAREVDERRQATTLPEGSAKRPQKAGEAEPDPIRKDGKDDSSKKESVST